MSRLVVGSSPGIEGLEQKTPADDYLSRLAKYIPGEIVAAYLAAQTIITSSNNSGQEKMWAFLAMVAILAALNPFYLKHLAKNEPQDPPRPWKRQAAVSTASFIVWVYALVEAPTALGVYSALIASLLLIVWTLIAGLILPETPPTMIVAADSKGNVQSPQTP